MFTEGTLSFFSENVSFSHFSFSFGASCSTRQATSETFLHITSTDTIKFDSVSPESIQTQPATVSGCGDWVQLACPCQLHVRTQGGCIALLDLSVSCKACPHSPSMHFQTVGVGALPSKTLVDTPCMEHWRARRNHTSPGAFSASCLHHGGFLWGLTHCFEDIGTILFWKTWYLFWEG